jgi:hypothetical protein
MRARSADPEQIEAEIARLRDLDLAALRVEWRKQMRSAPPEFMKRDLLLRAFAYELQVKAFGGLDRSTAHLLDRLARAADPGGVLATLRQRRLKPGTLLVREWAGEIHRVTVAESGFVWNEEIYKSLSEIARLITGTRWNGPRFFGLRESQCADDGVERSSNRAVSEPRRRGRPPKARDAEPQALNGAPQGSTGALS